MRPQSLSRVAERPPRPRASIGRWLLVALLVAVGINALGGAWWGLSGAPGVPREWLDGTPFDSYVLPSLYLGAVIGGSHLLAAGFVATRRVHARTAVLVASALLASWIVAQVAMIGFVSPLQPTMFIVAGIEGWLASRGAAGPATR